MDLVEKEFVQIPKLEKTQRIKKINKITKSGIVASLDEFAQNSTLHGLRFIVDRTLNYIEKLFWMIVVIVSISLCGILIQNVWVKWQSSPIIITMDEKLVPVNTVNYPSLTICPQIKIKENSFDFEAERKYYKDLMLSGITLKNLSRGSNKFADLSLVCDADLWINVMQPSLKSYKVNVDNIVEEALDYEDVFQWCQQYKNVIKCEDLFQKVLIRGGVCFTINSLYANKIVRSENVMNRLFLSKRSYSKYPHAVYPMKGSSSDSSAEFTITLREYLNYEDKSCKRYNTGNVVYFHNPEDLPHASIHAYTVKPNQILSLAFKVETMSTSEDLKLYPIETRQCYFLDEPYLQFFVKYTENNCRMECFTNYTKQLCGCVAYYMPHDNITRICTPYYMQCVDIAQTLLYGNLQPEKINDFIKKFSPYNISEIVSLMKRGKDFTDSCNCLPTCNAVNYNVEFKKKDYDFKYYYGVYCTDLQICNDNNKTYKYSRLEWIFKRPSFIGMTRSSMFGVTDFIAQCGGLLGLFLGFSFLTVVEIFYYLTMRLCFIIRQDKISSKTRRAD
ncbi:hypothetical protein K1T71_011947 [Dendrolimus kikuchii]|uniref:Uncharacterized protein n=1 Tax=Dendrolimus kikuchii TaxID=765133 RepID=A0ACC1CMJ9_9NEOP|nr:hypothetical protein K1T71_011947 [Dendrolimus kikuchii]